MRVKNTPNDVKVFDSKEPKPLAKISCQDAMKLAHACALKGIGHVKSNPLVGAVFVDKKHRFLAAGSHLKFGEAHAEVNGLTKIYKEGLEAFLDGAILYCTLEPCSHVGKTPSCANTLKNLKLSKVILASVDPNPLVSGKGIDLLRKKGVEVEVNSCFAGICDGLLDVFKWGLASRLPYVALKVAVSLNGVSGILGDRRAWITNDRSRRFGHWLRQYYDAIAVGAQTSINDNPELNIRRDDIERAENPYKIIFDTQGRAFFHRHVDEHAVFKSDSDRVVWVVSDEVPPNKLEFIREQLESKGARLCVIAKCSMHGSIDVSKALPEIARLGIQSILVEGGHSLWGSLITKKLVNKIYLFNSLSILSSPSALHWTKLCEGSDLTLKNACITPLDDNWLLEAYSERKK